MRSKVARDDHPRLKTSGRADHRPAHRDAVASQSCACADREPVPAGVLAKEASNMSDLMEMLKAQTEAINRAYAQGRQAGHSEGYRAGFNDGIEEAQKIINKVLPRTPTQEPSA